MEEKQVYAVKFYGDHPAPFKILNYIYHWGFLVTDGKDYNIIQIIDYVKKMMVVA